MAANLVTLFRETVERQGKKTAFRYKAAGKWQDLSWLEAAERVGAIREGLISLGIKRGEAVALFSSTRLEWTLADLAILSIGAITVPIYQSSTAEQASYIIQDAEAKAVIVENPVLWERVRGVAPRTVLIEGTAPGAVSLQDWLGRGNPGPGWWKEAEKIEAKAIATYVYTSGTTGPPKGAVLTHGNFLAELEALTHVFDITDKDESIVFLPLAHIVARALQFYHLKIGFSQAFAEGIDKLVDNLGEIRPHFFVAVPRIFEKVHERVLSQVEAGSPLKKGLFSWALSVGKEIGCRRQERRAIPLSLSLQHLLASSLVFQKLRDRLGGRLRYAVSGGAPLSREIGEFFAATGILILEGYGLTETTAAINCNRPEAYRFGTVGPAVQGVEEKIAADGEILVRGPVVFQGYFKKPEATREALTQGGWFHTGDIGEFDKDGFLKITDRKKDIIVTAGGKNVAPQNIENLLKTVPYISQAMVHGDRRKYLSALITLNQESVTHFAKHSGISFRDFRELTKHPKIFQLIQAAIEEKNKQLASFETIKKFAILENDFSQEAGELTPTLKLKRKVVSEKYQDILSRLYES